MDKKTVSEQVLKDLANYGYMGDNLPTAQEIIQYIEELKK